jgi:hypothetical protein
LDYLSVLGHLFLLGEFAASGQEFLNFRIVCNQGRIRGLAVDKPEQLLDLSRVLGISAIN